MKKTSACIIIVIAVTLLFSVPFTGTCLAKNRFVSIGTGGTGGVYYPYGGGVAEIWNKYVDGVKAVAEVTGASVENTKLCHKGETLFGAIMSDVAYQAYQGTGKFEGKPKKILGMFVMYPNVFHMVAPKKLGMKDIGEIKGKKVSVGAPGSGTEFMSRLVLEQALGLDYEQFNPFRLSFTETANALKDNTVDVGIWAVAPPTSSIMDLATTHDIMILPFTEAQVRKITEKFPFYSGYTLPANLYKGQETDVYTPSVWNTFICNAELDEELVYKLTKAVFEHQAYLISIHPFAKNTTPENTVKHSVIPLHPGSVKYLKEKGLTVPENLIAK
ncbi:C4-dicarboxylate ABC transporter substrate-bindi ng protein [Desulfonema ishimotonii]|uniref:C4-dicarboxylate ABC transporter substrate-bindi ng protein n=1 Tax=Desulfonema ishimotonii TaxID=45657 RepID=A0A401FZK7_9BACT|nr:TAXI family TRAP transporter solute-binding subunit [Desulfonema ishimotonii]GBC62411.1 C4-dicarboxylate ABC transporter substrate-bindi ng protein [Desulfonema ishimotonii]